MGGIVANRLLFVIAAAVASCATPVSTPVPTPLSTPLSTPVLLQETITRVEKLCVASPIELCGPGKLKYPCGSDLHAVARSFCTLHKPTGDEQFKYFLDAVGGTAGGQCGVTPLEIRCINAPVADEKNGRIRHLCIGDESASNGMCPPGGDRVPCGADVVSWAKSSCTAQIGGPVYPYYLEEPSTDGGGACGYSVFKVTCLLD